MSSTHIYIYIYRTCKIRNFLNCNEATFSWRSARIQDVINLINSALWVIQAIACRVSSLVKRVLFLSSPFFFFLFPFFFLSTPRVAYVSHVHSELFRNGMCRSCSVDYLHSCNTTQWYRLVDLLLSLILKRRLLNRALLFSGIFLRVYMIAFKISIYISMLISESNGWKKLG